MNSSLHRRSILMAALISAAGLTGCTTPTGPSDRGASAGQPQPDVALTIGLTYVPNVQFAPFYRAQQQGYFADHGVDVTLRHHGEAEDLFGALTQGTEHVVVAGGDEMMQARDQGVPVVSIATLYQQYPVALIVPDDSDITAAADIKGRTVGVPGPFGETWFGLLALLQGAGLTEQDIRITHIGYTQQSALAEGHVDAVMGFANNDVPQFAATGLSVHAVDIGEVPLAGIGLGSTAELIRTHSDGLSAVIAALEQAVGDLINDPELGVDAAIAEIPGTVDDEQRAIMFATMMATTKLYAAPGHNWGQHSTTWPEMAEFMAQVGLTTEIVPAEQAHTDAFTTDE